MARTEFLKKAKINVPDVSLLWKQMGFDGKYPVFLTVEEARRALALEWLTQTEASAVDRHEAKTGDGERPEAAAYEHTVFSYGEREILSDISQSIQTGDFIAVLGKNGAGKNHYGETSKWAFKTYRRSCVCMRKGYGSLFRG